MWSRLDTPMILRGILNSVVAIFLLLFLFANKKLSESVRMTDDRGLLIESDGLSYRRYSYA